MSSQPIQPGSVLLTSAGEKVTVGKKFDSGGQGFVSHAKFRGRKVVLKLWFEYGPTAAQLKELAANCQMSSPSRHFAWPIALIVDSNGRVIGYIMPFVGGKNCVTLKQRMFGDVETTYYALTTAAIELTLSMIRLHGIGRVYGDLNYGNAIFHRQTGQAWVCDLDNAVRDGVDIGLIYSFGCAAPSLIMGKSLPSIRSDKYALASLHFSFLTGGIPTEGRLAAGACALTAKELQQVHGKDALFVFHPSDDRNRPCPVMHAGVEASWQLLPGSIRDMFTRTFTNGLHDHAARYRETEWLDALVELRDSIVVCKCGAQVFHESGTKPSCWNCQQSVTPRRTLSLGGRRVVLNRGSSIFPHHTDRACKGDLQHPLATVVTHPSNKKVWGLKNESQATWSVMTERGELRRVAPGEVAPLARGNRVAFPGTEATVS